MKYQYFDLGTLDQGTVVEVRLEGNMANVRLLDSLNFSNYKNERMYKFTGLLAKESPVFLTVPRDDHWYVVVDLRELAGTVNSEVCVLN